MLLSCLGPQPEYDLVFIDAYELSAIAMSSTSVDGANFDFCSFLEPHWVTFVNLGISFCIMSIQNAGGSVLALQGSRSGRCSPGAC
jgi:hypothetical protein